uniref:hypothetical protein n=1 Tax=Marinobacterium profundum TaxID=1714300 RepID=UPI0008334D16|nr:hypothetical protein [Marinobacterium profundum]
MAVFHVLVPRDLDPLIGKFRRRELQAKAELSKAINKAARETINLTTDEWNSYFQLPRGYIDGKVKIVSGSTPGRMQAKVWARNRGTRANNFRYAAQSGRKGVMLNVVKGRGGGVIKNAFVIPRVKSDGKPLIVERLQKYQKGESRGFSRASKNGLRFKALYGPSVNQHFHDSRYRVAPQALSAAKQQFLQAMRQ